MGVIAESMVAYAQPLLDEADGSPEEMQRAFTLAQVCWNLALLPEMERDAEVAELRPSFHMDDIETVLRTMTVFACGDTQMKSRPIRRREVRSQNRDLTALRRASSLPGRRSSAARWAAKMHVDG